MFLSFPRLKPSVLLLSLTLFGCAPATSIQDLGWQQQSTLSSPVVDQAQGVQQPAPTPAYQPQNQIPQEAFRATYGGTPQQRALPPVAPDSQKIRVALLLPLSGPHAELGQAMANAAQLAVFDMGVNNFELLPRDTKGTAHGAVRAARDAMASGAKLIMGPLFAASVAAVKPVVLESNINMLGLSTDMSLAAPRAYMMGFAPAPQIERLVAFAKKRGIRNYAAMIPPGPYGMLVHKAFENAVIKAGGQVLLVDRRGDVAPIIENKSNIDGLFIPYGGSALRRLAAKLSAAGLEHDEVQLMGTGLWDAPNIAGKQDLLIDGWYAAPEPELHDHFMEGYQASFGKAPPRLATLAYDATALAAVLARNNMGYTQSAIELITGFAGVDGLFRLKANGKVERGLAINQVTSEGSLVIDKSPTTFTRETFN